MDKTRKQLKQMMPKTKEWVEQVKTKIKVCENCKDKKEAKSCISEIVNKA